MAERGSARASEQVFMTHKLMLSGPVAESDSRVARTSPPSQVQKIQSPGAVGCDWQDGYRQRAVGDAIFGGKHRIETFDLLTSGVGCHAIRREGRDGRGTYSRDKPNKASPGFTGGS